MTYREAVKRLRAKGFSFDCLWWQQLHGEKVAGQAHSNSISVRSTVGEKESKYMDDLAAGRLARRRLVEFVERLK